MIMLLIPLIIIVYLIGSIPTGYLVCKFGFNIDITRHGSGNIGATNVARVLGSMKFFFLIFFIDAAKAFLTLLVSDYFLIGRIAQMHVRQDYLLVCAMALLVGNACSVFLRFKGGKGVATIFGALLYLVSLPLILLFLFSWVLILMVTHYPFIASLGASFFLAISYGVFVSTETMLFYFFIAIFFWLLLRHKDNIRLFFYR